MEFLCFVIGLRRRNKYYLIQTDNADENAVSFDMPRNYTTNFKGEKHVAMKTTVYKKLRVTVMLWITENGNKLPPYNVLVRSIKQKETAKRKFFDDVIVRAQKMHGWQWS
jgi:hypothetical protein